MSRTKVRAGLRETALRRKLTWVKGRGRGERAHGERERGGEGASDELISLGSV